MVIQFKNTGSTHIYDSAFYIKDIKQGRALSDPLLTRKRHGYRENQRGPTLFPYGIARAIHRMKRGLKNGVHYLFSIWRVLRDFACTSRFLVAI